MYVKMSGGFKKMNDRESKRLEESIDKIKIAIEYAGEFLTDEEFNSMIGILKRLENKLA